MPDMAEKLKLRVRVNGLILCYLNSKLWSAYLRTRFLRFAPTTDCAAFSTRLHRSFRIVFKISATGLSAFASRVCSTLWIFREIT